MVPSTRVALRCEDFLSAAEMRRFARVCKLLVTFIWGLQPHVCAVLAGQDCFWLFSNVFRVSVLELSIGMY